MLDAAQAITLTAAFLAGAFLGALYFGGLWWTVRRLPHARQPLNLYFGSLAARVVLVLAGFYGVLAVCDWPQLMAALAGFLMVRLAAVRFAGASALPAGAVSRKETA